MRSSKQNFPATGGNLFLAFVTRGFTFRRKQLINAFSRETEEKEIVASVLKHCGIEPSARPENLGIEEWLRFYKKFSE
jgi:16S rRNA A1518/A1519 N6-dimethyltransferase RsmA/KsgA/DIM1 with predicted DNA glycosylase/AP lyase activity